MDIVHVYRSAQTAFSKVTIAMAAGIIQAARSDIATFQKWKENYIKIFESMQFSERRVLLELKQYNLLLYVYDRLKSNIYVLLTNDDVQTIANVEQFLNQFIRSIGPYIDNYIASAAEKVSDVKPKLSIVFPLGVNRSTTADLIDEQVWFFKVFNSAYSEMDKSAEGLPTIRRVENIDVSIAVEVNWQFMLVTAAFLYAAVVKINKKRKHESTVDALRELGVGDDTIRRVDEEISKVEDEGFEQAINEISSVYEGVKDGNIEPALRAYFNRIREAKAKGYQIGVDLPESKPGTKKPLPEEIAKHPELEHIRRLMAYDRQQDQQVDLTPKAIEGS
ncbi:hypothetical protein ABID26_002404 [Mesorhizobium shonense]|uniref:Uncharacterized protein n=1 Tax=Mesorhizobium shonense TaxID=1209948 RepID=A0ABV2HR04_9HYPH|nr:hypothetical protein [Mesorhizobium sp.]RWB17829.1 MAG: hypothetical protein EOQ40_25145 [Mesorhizobium sp.]